MSFPIQTSMKEVLRKIVTAIILINLVVSTTAFAQSSTPLVLNNLEQAIAKEDVIPQSSNLDDVNDDQEALQFVFTVSPNQVTPGDEVEFVITLTNTGTKEISGVRVSNFLPSLLKKPKSKNGDITVDNKSNSIAWTGESKQENGATLLPGETITLEYSATVDAQIDHDIQILDEAEVQITGAPTPITASLALNILLEKTSGDFTLLGSKGGQANGANGHVHIKVPSGELGETDGILIQNLGQDISSNLEQPLLYFQLDVLTPDQNLQKSGAPNTPEPLPATSTTEPTPTPTEVSSEVSASATPDEVGTSEITSEAPSETSTPSELEITTATPNIASTPTTAPSILEERDEASPLIKGKSEFNQPLEITVSFDGILNLSELGEGYAPYLATLDESSGNWTQIPLKAIDLEKNTITAEITHFSVWGVGIGSSSPQNGPNVMFYDSPYPDLFTGRSTYSFPIWSPTGRNGMAPNLSLSYSGNTVNGILGDVQSPWAGMGWNTDLIEIVRKIKNGNCSPCGSGLYGYENKYLLMVNGTGFELLPNATVPGRYHTKIESFLYIQLHNDALGNNTPTAPNGSGEWWEVVERDGTRWRLGWNADSEQLAAMKGYPGAASGTWTALGYAGHATNVVAMRWRADRVTDTHGNYMTASYVEETRPIAGTATNYDRASYLDTILYTSHTSGSPASGYSVVFVRESRSGLDQPATQTEWDNWDTYRLDRIDVKYGASVVRSYDLSYDVRSYTDDGKSWQTTVLASIATSGSGTNAPTIVFGYTDQNNRANCGVGCQEWAYPRLTSVANGLGGVTTFTYGNDGRPNTSWYNWRLESVLVNDGVNPNPMKTTFSYSTPCYYDSTAGWCNASNIGELVGYGQTTVTTLDFDGTTILAKAIRKFYSDEQKAGREYETQNQNASGTTLSQVNTTFTVSTSGLPSGGFFTFASAVDAYLLAGSLTRVNHTEYQYDASTGNLTTKKQFDGTPTLYRQTAYEYVTNTSASVWILNSVSRITLTDSIGTVVAQQEFGYDGNLPANGQPTLGELTLSRIVSGSQTIDTKFIYDAYGNITDINLYKNYGVTGSQPTGTFASYSAVYDAGTKTFPITRTNPLGHQTQTGYNFGLGLPTSATDPNNNTTTTLYDGLGRVKEVTYPGYAQPNIKYTYPTPPVSAPFAILTEVWDQTASTYLTGGQIMDGLGRSIQKQGPFETAGTLNLTDYSYNALGLMLYQGLPRTVSGTSGSYFAPGWGSVPHTAASYDALGRTTLVSYPDASNEIFSYNGLRVTTIDRNGHQKIRESDAFGRTVKVEEYLGSGSYTLYATTVYEYDARDLLKKITDAHGKQTSIGYNGFGRKDSMTDPDMGTWGYGYDVFGNLTSQTDARTCTINVLYDDLNRPTQKTYSGPGACATTPAVNYTYDSTIAGNEGIGFRTGMTDGSGSSSWVYNTLGQQTQKNQVIDGTNYSNAYTFDALNRPLTQTLPSGETLNYGYNAMGSLSSLSGSSTYVSQIHYNAAGQVIDQQLGNGLYQQACYETNTLRVSKLRTYVGPLQSCGSTPSNLKLDLSYTYQPNGNISQIVDATQGDTINYTYDELDRLLSASGDNNKNYGYNESGNVVNLTTIPNLVAVSTGSSSACGLTASGGVKCWGANDRGQLGDGTQTQRLLPVDVSGLTNGVVAIAVGDKHACALTSSGGVKCWGYNFFGQLGNNTTTDSLTPVDVSGLTSGVVAISAGGNSTCAITSSGGLKCWGGNDFGQVGDGTSTNRSNPVNVSGMTSGVSTVSVGNLFTCAVTTSGAAKCWGRNLYGNLGDGTTKNRKTPTNVSGLTSGVTDIDAGSFHTCAVMTNGGLKCWGDNSFGQVGDGTTTNRLAPVNVSGISFGISSVAAGGDHTCALLTIGGAKCWGRNQNGQVGDGTTTTPRYFPVYVSGFNSNAVTAIDTGISFSCAVTTTLGIKCWGSNSNGEFGNGATTSSSIPVSANFNVVNGYTYGDPTSAHAVTSLSNGSTYTYDANGNMTERLEGGVVYTQTFDAENRLISVTANSQTTQFIYDGDGNLVKMVKPDGSKTIFVGKTYEVDKSSSGTVTRTVTYYPAGGAVRINSTLYYVLKDHLGSTYATTDSSGNILGEMRYYAFGETRLVTGSISTDRLYTSQRYLAGIGLYYYGARFYSATLGRFISADSMIPNVYNPQDLNRFTYVRNNPTNYTDPTGHEPKYGCYEVNCTNANGTTLTSSQIASASSAYQFQCGSACAGGGDEDQGDNNDTVILACGYGAGPNCDNTEGYGDTPLAPYYQLGMPLIYGPDGYPEPQKLNAAIDIYNYIKNNPGDYILVGHSAGGTALVIVASMLQKEGFGDQIAALVLLDPYFDTNYPIDQYGNLGDIQDVANQLAPSGIPVFLGDSPTDGDDEIVGAIQFSTDQLGYEVNHLQLATNTDIYNLIVNDPSWNP